MFYNKITIKKIEYEQFYFCYMLNMTRVLSFKGDQKICLKKKICPICKKHYDDAPSLSRKANKTKICSNCGVKEEVRYFIDYQKGDNKR